MQVLQHEKARQPDLLVKSLRTVGITMLLQQHSIQSRQERSEMSLREFDMASMWLEALALDLKLPLHNLF